MALSGASMTTQHAAFVARGQVDLATEPDFRLGPLLVRPSACRVLADHRSVDLQPKVMQVLVVLAAAQGRAVSREDLLAACWGGVAVGDDSVHRCIARLRRLSEADLPGAFTIVTQARVGYRLVAEPPDEIPDDTAVAGAPAQPPPALPATPETSGPPIARPGPKRGGMALAAVVVLALLALVLARALSPGRSPYRVAVRTFDVVGEPADLGASQADRIADAISGRQLPVVSRARSRHGDTHGAQFVVGGEIHRIDHQVRVDVHLDDARSGLTLWAESITRAEAESDALQDQVAGKVADLIDLTRVWLGRDADRVKPEAMAALFTATDAMRSGAPRILETREGFRRFRDLAPDISKGHSGYAMATILAADTQPSATADQWRSEARREAQRAIALDAKNPEGYMALGVLTPDSDLVQRRAWYARGLAVDPEDASLCDFTGDLLLDVGLTGDAVSWLNRGLRLDPLSPPKTRSLIRALSVAGRFDEAAALFPRARRLWPDDPPMLRTIVLESLIYAPPAEALAALARLQASPHPMAADHAAAWRRYEAARAGTASRSAAALGLLSLIGSAGGGEVDAAIAGLGSLGDAEDAFRAIDIARATQQDWSTSTLFEPATAALRKDSRFGAVAGRFGLTRYWAMTAVRPDVCATADRCNGAAPS